MDESKHAPIADVPKFTKDDLPKPPIALQPTHASGSNCILAGPILETQPPLNEPSTSLVQSDVDGSPLSVREHMARMVVHCTKLGEEVATAKEASDAALAVWREKRDELEETTRILRAYERIRSPKRRKQP